MIVVDTSALLAVFFAEAEATDFAQRMVGEDQCLMSVVNVHEAMTVVRIRRGRPGIAELAQLVIGLRLTISGFDEHQVAPAADAFDRFGKGIHSRARLNICDCAA